MNQDLSKQFQIPWYKKGLSFNCTQCGKCCTGLPGYIWVSEDEIEEIAKFLHLPISDIKRLYMKKVGQRWSLVERKSQGHSCVFYHEQKCQVYAARPLQCRAYPFWQENLLSEESWKAAAVECEGIHSTAPLISVDVINDFLEEQRKKGPEEHFIPPPKT